MHKTTLNPSQQEAVDTLTGPVLILAGAGAGKTKTITHRILNLIKHGPQPEKILAVTFTNKAAKEMRERTRSLLAEDASVNFPGGYPGSPFVSTFHSLGVSLLRENAQALGLNRHFAIYDRNDSVKAVKDAIKAADLDPKQFAPRSILSAISKQKGDAVTRKQYEEKVGNAFYPRIVADVWARYERTLTQDKALDFDDLILSTLQLLKNNPGIRERYQERWDHIHIDEYQDTNKVQYNIAKLLSDKHKNICCVGDIDQNIYAWRGADINNILQFEQHFPDTKLILLEENYRSTKTIVAVSNDIIEKNTRRRDKTLFTNNKDGDKMSLYVAYDESDEAQFIANKSKELIEQGIEPGDIAVLYRANFQSRILEESFLREEVPYQVLGTKFFDRKEIKDMTSFVRAALGGTVTDLKRIVNVPTRGIGKATLLKMVENKVQELSPAAQKKVQAFYEILADIKEQALILKPSETLKFVLARTGIETELKNGSDEDKERLENIRELVTLATKYDEMEPEEGIAKLLDDAALASDQDEMKAKEEQNAVRLMTIHASKGLEFDKVFICGLEEGLFPHEKIGETKDDDEEERRLFYVALTRAKEKVFLTYANVRTIFGSRQVNLPSEFITDIDEDYLESEDRAMGTPGGEGVKVIYLD